MSAAVEVRSAVDVSTQKTQWYHIGTMVLWR